MTLRDFFEKLVYGEILSSSSFDLNIFENVKRAEISQTPTSTTIQASQDCNIIKLVNIFGSNIHFYLENEINSTINTPRNSFDVLMQSARNKVKQLYLPNFSHYKKPNQKQLLQCDIVKWIHQHGERWKSKEYANSEGKEFIYIDMRSYEKLKNRSYHIPDIFMKFFNRADPESYKEAQKPFNAQELNIYCQDLAPYVIFPWMFFVAFSWLREPLDNFIIVLSQYVGFLCCQQEITTKNHALDNYD
ncbi:16797_t:CDS:2 [Gigaspora margarita]|uniref:16797_t:CDS:1 n=1 Tax=Gigaspora margarita TaxID=4874 RepID=A0ABN7W288_GIGMA|nr:16797_t:CDS:2 [Gigaspora margarita]